MSELELYAIKFNLRYFKTRRIIPDSNNVRKLRSKFGTTKEVARYLEHRLQQLEGTESGDEEPMYEEWGTEAERCSLPFEEEEDEEP